MQQTTIILVLRGVWRTPVICVFWLFWGCGLNAQTMENLETTLSSLTPAQQISLLNDQKQLMEKASYEEQARYWYLLGLAFDYDNQPQPAIDAYSTAINISEQQNLRLTDTLPRSYVERSYMKYIQTYDPNIYCEDRFKALQLSRQLANPELLVKVLVQAAFCFGGKPEKLQQGLALLVEAIDVADKNNFDNSSYGMIYNASGNLYQENQLFDKAYEYIQKAYDAWAKVDDFSDMFNMQHTLVALAIDMQNFTAARQHVDRLFEIAKQQPQFSDFTFFSHYNAGILAFFEQQYPLAVSEFEKALALRDTTEEHHFIVQSLYPLVIAYFNQGIDSKARSTLDQLLIDSPDKNTWPMTLRAIDLYYAGNNSEAMHLMVAANSSEVDKRRTFIAQYQHAANTLVEDSLTKLDNKVLQQTLEINRLQLAEEQSQKRLAQILIAVSVVIFAALFGFVMHLIKTRRLFKHRAQIDYLTQIANRRTIFELGYKLLNEAKMHNKLLSILIIDIDHFKRVNDTLGHEVGDHALTLVSQRALGCLRQLDKIGRIGGEEFMVLLPDTGSKQALDIAERIRKEIEKSPLRKNDEDYSLTISIGLAVASADETLESAMARADTALYNAKQKGRNQVVVTS
ncbi:MULTISPECIES: GGDEF domain-containing protein [Aliiglaciecola]|uniref:GGDEF domain-containing protein n=1 Tax=Aliiglaciecola TaxID=1406885 RepID=UPI001C09367F|nr:MULTISPECIES: GGDEF domain-containing protein [Aliiglaciecola]MBU2876085.1 GGDEF domain-containing protein [Aliiglaciecola lipolytica]MDO6713286.1 GGDEF domain-containing protein [Aliiglaciecola sp. 2_MG-2023]MDO6754433.1 GGDEF domain-containing protein [Aliiglaciecola sp. 1_MG-2023]